MPDVRETGHREQHATQEKEPEILVYQIESDKDFSEYTRIKRLAFEETEADTTLEKTVLDFETALLKKTDSGSGKIFSFLAQEGDQAIGGARLKIIHTPDRARYASLDTLAVLPEHRKKGVAKKLTEIRIEKAREQACEWVETKVDGDNALGLLIKFKSGFTLTDPQYYLKNLIPELILKKDLLETDHNETKKQIITIPLSDLEHLINSINDGWEGFDITTSDPSNLNPKNWMVHLRK